MAKSTYKIAVIPGDGIGRDVIPEAVKAMNKAADVFGLSFDYINITGGAQYYLETGKEWDDGSFESCRDDADAILLGAVGWPGARLPDGNIAGAGIVFGLRFGLDLYANVRPTKLLPGMFHKIHNEKRQIWKPGLVDLVTVRENTEGAYSPIRGILDRGGSQELAVDSDITTLKGATRVIKYAFELAMTRNGAPGDKQKRVTCVDKANVLAGSRLFRATYDRIAEGYPKIAKDYAYIDAYLQWLVRNPENFDVVVSSNMFGDISSDLAAVLGGSLGMAASGNIGDKHGLFEPIHGSAPKHAGKNEANPIASISTVAMLFDYLGRKYDDKHMMEASKAVDQGVEALVMDGSTLTYDLGGTATTSQVGDKFLEFVKE